MAQCLGDGGCAAENIRFASDWLQPGDDRCHMPGPAGLCGDQPEDCRDDFFIGQRTAPVLPSARQATTATQRFKALVHVQRRIGRHVAVAARSEEHTSELQSLMRISYAVLCLKKKTKYKQAMAQKTKTK